MRRALLLAVALLAAPVALAQAGGDGKHVAYGDSDDERARELYENGQILYDEGMYASAILAWEEAYDLSKRPLLLFNISNAYERMGAWDQALETLTTYRAFAHAEERPALERRIRVLEERVAAAAPEPEPQPVDPAPVPTEAEIAEIEAMEVPSAPVGSVTDAPPRKVRVLPVALFGAGGVGLGVGAGFGMRSTAARSAAEAECLSTDSGLLCSDAAEPHLAREKSSGIVADVGLIVGAAAIAGGLVTVLVDAGPLRIGPSVSARGAGLRVGAAF